MHIGAARVVHPAAPRHLHGRGAQRKNAQAVPHCQPRQIYQNVNAAAVNDFGGFVIRFARNHHKFRAVFFKILRFGVFR